MPLSLIESTRSRTTSLIIYTLNQVTLDLQKVIVYTYQNSRRYRYQCMIKKEHQDRHRQLMM